MTFTGTTLAISAEGLVVTLLLGAADMVDCLQAVTDPIALVFTVTGEASQDVAGLPLAPGALSGTGAF